MSKMDDVADDLAIRALDLEEQTGDENVVRKVADALGSSSPTMEETFLTAIRMRRAERRARRLIESLTPNDPVLRMPPPSDPGEDKS